MKTLGYYNGKFGPLEEMTVPMNDRACYFGDGVYEATLAKNGKIFALKEHLDRFFNSAHLLAVDQRNRNPSASVPGKRNKGQFLDLYEARKTRQHGQTVKIDRYGRHPVYALQY